MTLPYTTELDAITDDYYMADGKAATDIHFNSSFLLNWFMKQQKGLWKRPGGGIYMVTHFMFDQGVSGAYEKADPLSSDDREILNAARFLIKHYYSNATIYRTDELANSGGAELVDLVTNKVSNAQESITSDLATDLYGDSGDTAKYLTGLKTLTSETTSATYGGVAETDLLSSDGSYNWEGKTDSDAKVISLDLFRDMATACKLKDGKMGKIDLVTMPEALFNPVLSILQLQQIYTEAKETVDAGFTGVKFEGKKLVADDYCPSANMFGVNSNFVGFGIHKNGYFVRDKWRKLDGPMGRTMKILWDGNLICNNRKAHIRYSSVTAS